MRFLSQRPVTSLPKTEDRTDLGSDLLEGLAHRTETRVHPRSYSPNAGEFLRTSDDARKVVVSLQWQARSAGRHHDGEEPTKR